MLFRQIPFSQSDILFNNKITERHTINPFDVVNIYKGGVSIRDFNNDGLQDNYFVGEVVSNNYILIKELLIYADLDYDGAMDIIINNVVMIHKILRTKRVAPKPIFSQPKFKVITIMLTALVPLQIFITIIKSIRFVRTILIWAIFQQIKIWHILV